jgi:HAD superfamily hydrolase (TIGR01484 family)
MSNCKVCAIISDYDGTLCPVSAVRTSRIPRNLEETLWEMSEELPVCILSSKDFHFLHDKTPFAKILSCLLGIETLVFRENVLESTGKPKSRHLLIDKELLHVKAEALDELSSKIASRFADVLVERKLTFDDIIAGITFDWRDLQDWKYYSRAVSGYVKSEVKNQKRLHVQTYRSHPFIDVYAAKCDKGVGFDRIATEIRYSKGKGEILYLGDSDNDNPAFKRAGVSVGVQSDSRLKPSLDCNYKIEYDKLASFLQKLKDNNFIFAEGLIE